MTVTILVADDSATMRRILEMTFAGEDAKVVCTSSTDEALRKLAETKVDLIFADLSMDGRDGYELSRAVKGNPATQSIPVVAMASQHNAFDAERGRAAGIDDHVIKPFDTQVILDRVAQLLSRPRAATSGVGALPTAAAAGQSGAHRVPAQPTPSAPAQTAAARPASASTGSAPHRAPPPPPPARSAPTSGSAPRIAPVESAVTRSSARAGNELTERLGELGLSRDQVEAVVALSRDVIERVVWEVVPDLAETMIREEIRRLTASQ